MLMPSSMVLQGWQDHYLCCSCSSKPCLCVCVKGIAAGCRAAQWSLSSLMRLHCPNLTANPIVMLCTLMAEGAARPGLCSTGDPLVWCLLKPQRRGWWIFLGLGASVTVRRGEGSPMEARTSGREQSAALGTLSGTNSCAVFCRVMQLFCSQII